MGCFGILSFIPLFSLLSLSEVDASKATSCLWHEDLTDTLMMLSQNGSLRLIIMALFLCLFCFNIGMFELCKIRSALEVEVLNLLVSPCVWCFDLLAGVCSGYSGQGRGTSEVWDNWSYLQLCGYLILVAGTLRFHGVIGTSNDADS